MRVLVCGGRNYTDVRAVAQTLSGLGSIAFLIEGGATGADALARAWAVKNAVPCLTLAVDHDLDGPWPGAGPRRNARMLRDAHPDLVVAMPGGRGTADMVRRALAAGIRVVYGGK